MNEEATTEIAIVPSDLPCPYDKANQVSESSQEWYYRLAGANIVVLIGAAIVGAVSFSPDRTGGSAALVTAVLLAVSLAVSTVLQMLPLARNWFDGRAVAESIKTVAWRYMMQSEPFDNPSKDTDVQFCSRVSEILRGRKRFLDQLGGESDKDGYISEKMRLVRNSNRGTRRTTYINQRIREQRSWYSGRTKTNRDNENKWFVVMLVAQLFALIFAMVRVRYLWSVNMTPVFISSAAAIMAWRQLKRYQELAQAYGLATQDLTDILARGENIGSDQELSKYVSDAENAISREHTIWLARRDNV